MADNKLRWSKFGRGRVCSQSNVLNDGTSVYYIVSPVPGTDTWLVDRVERNAMLKFHKIGNSPTKSEGQIMAQEDWERINEAS